MNKIMSAVRVEKNYTRSDVMIYRLPRSEITSYFICSYYNVIALLIPRYIMVYYIHPTQRLYIRSTEIGTIEHGRNYLRGSCHYLRPYYVVSQMTNIILKDVHVLFIRQYLYGLKIIISVYYV